MKYNVSLNSQESESFSPTEASIKVIHYLHIYFYSRRGTRHFLKHKEELGNLLGVKVGRSASSISILLFDDDSLILTKADRNNANSLRRALYAYCTASG